MLWMSLSKFLITIYSIFVSPIFWSLLADKFYILTVNEYLFEYKYLSPSLNIMLCIS